MSYDEKASLRDSEDADQTWAGGIGFRHGGEIRKWKATRRFLFIWPLYTESLTLTDTEVHIKRNECPALPRECRPWRSWAVIPLEKVNSFYMKKQISRVAVTITLLISIFLGFMGGVAITVYAGTTVVHTKAELINAASTYSSMVYGSLCVLGTFVLLLTVQTFRAPLRLVIRGDGISSEDGLGIDLRSGSVDPEEIKLEIDNAKSKWK